jgi:tetratricopeptide (TPR) repeat protein
MIAGKEFLLLAAVLLSGCAGSIPIRVERPVEYPVEPAAAAAQETPDIFRGVPGKYRELSYSAEKAGDLGRALLYRKVVHGFAPEDAEARQQVERLEKKIRGQADRDYKAALALEEAGESAKALRVFLAVLVLDPGHEGAFQWVKNRKNGGSGPEFRTWKVREGDTLRKIAAEAYRDPDKEFLVAYFNRLPTGSPVPAGSELRLPDIDTGSSKTEEKAPGYSNPERDSNEPRSAAERKESAERKVREADAHYVAGVQHFLAEDLEGAIREWGKALALDPAHPKARKDIEKARRLKGKTESAK